MCHVGSMITGSQYLRNRVSAGATARLAHGFTGPEFAERNLETWLHQVAAKIRHAISRQIPVGFEDETGFHLGVQRVRPQDGMDWERARILLNDEYF
jgi:hypothetical protein